MTAHGEGEEQGSLSDSPCGWGSSGQRQEQRQAGSQAPPGLVCSLPCSPQPPGSLPQSRPCLEHSEKREGDLASSQGEAASSGVRTWRDGGRCWLGIHQGLSLPVRAQDPWGRRCPLKGQYRSLEATYTPLPSDTCPSLRQQEPSPNSQIRAASSCVLACIQH